MKIDRDNVSIIHKDCFVEGKLQFSGCLIVAGTIQGTLEAETVVTQEGSIISGELKIISLTVAGAVTGNITAERLILLKTADVQGSIRCASLIVENGGLLNANIKRLNKE